MARQAKTKVMKRLPKATAQYPHLNTPDTKFNAEGEYTCALIYDLKDPMTTKVKEYLDAQVARAKAAMEEREGKQMDDVNLPYVLDAEGGTLTVKTKQKAFTYKNEKVLPKPQFFDASGVPMKGEVPYIRGGSIIGMAVEVVPYLTQEKDRRLGRMINIAGVTLRPKAVQIIQLSAGGASAADFGFEAEEGFSAEDDFESFSEEDAAAEAQDAKAPSDADLDADVEF